jgi:hypothetical protein
MSASKAAAVAKSRSLTEELSHARSQVVYLLQFILDFAHYEDLDLPEMDETFDGGIWRQVTVH